MSHRRASRRGQVRTAVGLSLALASLGVVLYLTCRPADADHPGVSGGSVQAASGMTPRTSVVASVLRSQARLAAPGTPISDPEWALHHASASVRGDEALSKTLIARTIPPPGKLELDSEPSSPDAPIGGVAHLDDGSLRVIDGWTNGARGVQIELRLVQHDGALPQVEAGAWDLRGNEAPAAWRELACAVSTSRSTWADGERVVLHYRVTGLDSAGEARDESGLVRVVVP